MSNTWVYASAFPFQEGNDEQVYVRPHTFYRTIEQASKLYELQNSNFDKTIELGRKNNQPRFFVIKMPFSDFLYYFHWQPLRDKEDRYEIFDRLPYSKKFNFLTIEEAIQKKYVVLHDKKDPLF